MCYKLLPRDAFGDKQLIGRCAKTRSDGHRFCLHCGIRKNRIQSAHAIRINNRNHHLCRKCMKLRGYGLFCLTCGNCERCTETRRHRFKGLGIEIKEGECPECQSRWPAVRDLGKPEPDIYRARPAEGGFGIRIGLRPGETAMSLSMRMRDFFENRME